MNPGLALLRHLAEPNARVNGQIANELEYRQGIQTDQTGQIGGLGAATECRLAVDHHAARAADGRAASEIELQARIESFTNLVQCHEQ